MLLPLLLLLLTCPSIHSTTSEEEEELKVLYFSADQMESQHPLLGISSHVFQNSISKHVAYLHNVSHLTVDVHILLDPSEKPMNGSVVDTEFYFEMGDDEKYAQWSGWYYTLKPIFEWCALDSRNTANVTYDLADRDWFHRLNVTFNCSRFEDIMEERRSDRTERAMTIFSVSIFIGYLAMASYHIYQFWFPLELRTAAGVREVQMQLFDRAARSTGHRMPDDYDEYGRAL